MACLTTKELGAITDALVGEKIKIDKAAYYASAVTDATLKAEFEREKQKHEAHFARLYALL